MEIARNSTFNNVSFIIEFSHLCKIQVLKSKPLKLIVMQSLFVHQIVDAVHN